MRIVAVAIAIAIGIASFGRRRDPLDYGAMRGARGEDEMRVGGWSVAMAALGMLAAFAHPAAAQIVRSPEEIRACLCKEQGVSTLNQNVQNEARAYEEKRRAFETLDKQVQSSRTQVNVNNPSDVDAFKRLLDQRDAAADALAGPATRSYADTVQRYNQAVAEYNGSCAGKSFDADAMAAEKRALSCPRP